jgi:tRNA (guanine-N7-)-methyltransferase
MDGMSESGMGGAASMANTSNGVVDASGANDAADGAETRLDGAAIALERIGSTTADGTAQRFPARPVLSFVRRSGRLDDRLQRAWDRYHDCYLLDVNQAPGSLSVREGLRIDEDFVRDNWGNAHPLIVEIGTGQGENVVAAAQGNPETNFLALEVYDPGVAHTMLLAGKRDLANLRIAQVNAPEFFAAASDGLIGEVWTFFPDPWPKMRHHKRRIVQDELAAQIHRTLVAGGVWRIATDIEDYALHVHEVMDNRVDFENLGGATVSLPLEHVGKGNAGEAMSLPHAEFAESLRFEGRVLTNFEKKGVTAGRVIHDFAYRAV